MRISDWSSDVCSSDLVERVACARAAWSAPIWGRLSPGTAGLPSTAARPSRRWKALFQDTVTAASRAVISGTLTRGGLREIGRASCRERVCQDVWISDAAVTLKKKIQKI